MGLFDEKRSFSREELRSVFKKDTGRIPKTGGQKYNEQRRRNMVGSVFGSKYGGQISRDDYKKAVRDLKIDSIRAKTPEERTVAKRGMDYLKKMGGI